MLSTESALQHIMMTMSWDGMNTWLLEYILLERRSVKVLKWHIKVWTEAVNVEWNHKVKWCTTTQDAPLIVHTYQSHSERNLYVPAKQLLIEEEGKWKIDQDLVVHGQSTENANQYVVIDILIKELLWMSIEVGGCLCACLHHVFVIRRMFECDIK